MLTLSNVYQVFRVHPHPEKDDIHHMVVGKFLLTPNHFEVLEDNSGILSGLKNKSPAAISAFIHRLNHSMYYRIVNMQDVVDGHHPEFIKESKAPEVPAKAPSFVYHRNGMVPQELEFSGEKAYLDGHLLTTEDLQLLHENITNGAAKLEYKSDNIQKAEEFFMDFSKSEDELQLALKAVKQAVAEGHISQEQEDAIHRAIYMDSMVPGIGNKKAYADFLSRPRQGVHIRMDAANFGAINKIYGFEAGDQAIVSLMTAVREAMDEAVGSKHAKLFRIGADEAHSHVPSYDDAALFVRTLRAKLESIPPIGGTHPLAMSVGIGPTPEYAEMAMIESKNKAKLDPGYKEGKVKTHAYTAEVGNEGHVPTAGYGNV